NAMDIQYTQKARKPCQGPKSLRVQRYKPPAPGCLIESAPTATARGTVKNTAERTQSDSDPAPACAADEIQRVPTMQLMANRVTSRRPSSRRSAAEGSGLDSRIAASIHY